MDYHVGVEEDLAWLGAPLASLEVLGETTLTEVGIDAVADQIENVFVRSLWCQQKEVVSEAVKVTRRLVRRCVDEERTFPHGEKRLRGWAGTMLAFLRGTGKAWRYEKRILRGLAN